MELDSVLKGTNVLDCLECGKCTSNCPISRFDRSFSPRYTISSLRSRQRSCWVTRAYGAVLPVGCATCAVRWTCITASSDAACAPRLPQMAENLRAPMGAPSRHS